MFGSTPLLLMTLSAAAADQDCVPASPIWEDFGDLSALDLPAAPAASRVDCEDDCGPRGQPGKWAGDGMCDDGGPGATNSECEYGSDCEDCGPRGCDEEHPCPRGQECTGDGECDWVLGEIPDCPPGELPGLGYEAGADGSDLVPFTPYLGDGYHNYPENGETEDDMYRSYVRRDVRALVKYAAAWTRCLGQDWEFGNGAPLGLGDMSEADGSIPGTRERDPGHPSGSHLYGKDMDIAYYQLDTIDNQLRPICEHRDARGNDHQRCVSPPDNLDVMRTAVFLAMLHGSDSLRIIGVDGKVGPLIEDAWERLCEEGWLDEDNPVCHGDGRLAYETRDTGRGWYRFHHHHFHISTYGGSSEPPEDPAHIHHDGCMHQGEVYTGPVAGKQ